MNVIRPRGALAVVAMASVFSFSVQGLASSGPHWGYSGEEGAENWGKLSPEYAVCGTGLNQSPIDLANFVEAELEPLALSYTSESEKILNNGHTIQLNYTAGSTLTVDGKEFHLKQIHFHAPSENTIEGKYFPMEGHLVHAAADGELAVVSVMYSEGKANEAMEAAWAAMPVSAHEEKAAGGVGSVDSFLPAGRDYYRFNGSLTTPPCTEGVRWLVMKEPAEVSAEQIRKFEEVMHGPNNRPVQPRNARVVLK